MLTLDGNELGEPEAVSVQLERPLIDFVPPVREEHTGHVRVSFPGGVGHSGSSRYAPVRLSARGCERRGMREFTVAAVKLLDLELGPYLYDDDNEGREIMAVWSGVGALTGWIGIEYRDGGPKRWVRARAVVSLRTP